MAAVTKLSVAPGFTFDPATRVQQVDEADEARRQRLMQRAWNYYDGFMPNQLKVRPNDYDDNVRLEYPRLVVDTALSFLFGEKVSFEATPPAGSETPEQTHQDALDAAWGDDETRMNLLTRLGLNGTITGHCYLKLQPMEDHIRLIVLDSANVDVDWDPQDFTRVVKYTVDWIGFDSILQKNVAFKQEVVALFDEADPETTVAWNIVDSRSVGGSEYAMTDEEIWPYEFAPIVDCQNLPAANEFYGTPELTDTSLDLCDRINGAASNIQKILRYHASPKVFVYGYSGAPIDLATDVAVNFPSSDTQVGILGMPTDLGAAFNMLDRLTDNLLLLTRTPRAALGDPMAAAAAASGLALKLSFMPLIDKTSTKRNLYGTLLEEVNRRILVLSGYEDPPDVQTNWPSITPDDPMADAQTALLWQQAGASKQTTLAQAGFDAELEAQQAADEAQTQMTQMQQQMAAGSLLTQDTTSITNNAGAMSKRSNRLANPPLGSSPGANG